VKNARRDERPIVEVASGISAAAVSDAQSDLTFFDLLVLILQHKRLIALVTAIGTLSAMLIAFLSPVRYTATVVVLPPRGSTVVNPEPEERTNDKSAAGSGKSTVVPARRDINDLYVSLLRSRPIEDSVIQRFGLMSEYHTSSSSGARAALEERTNIDGARRDGLIRLSFTARNPYRASEVANGYIELFQAYAQHLIIPEAVRDGYFLQVVEPALPPEQRASPRYGLMTMAGAIVGLTIGIMFALLRGGLARLQNNPATRAKIDVLKDLAYPRRAGKPLGESDANALHASREPARS